MSNIELEFARSNLIETVGTAVSCGEISIEEAVSLFAERLSAFVLKSRSKECAGLQDSEFAQGLREVSAMKDISGVLTDEDIPSTVEEMNKAFAHFRELTGMATMTAAEAREIL